MVNPTGYTALDLIGFTDKGTYSSSDNYVKNDLVHYSGNIWRCLIDDTTGITPAEGVNWTLFIGEPTNLVEAAIASIEQTPSTSAYTVGRRLFYNDILYEVIAAIAVGDNLIAYEDDPTNANIKVSAKVEEQIDSINSALTNVEDNLSHQNLLDNPWFTVNQREFTSGDTVDSYTVDRWKINSGNYTVALLDNVITLTKDNDTTASEFVQYFERERVDDLSGKQLTLSVMLSDGTVHSATATMPTSLTSTLNYFLSITVGDFLFRMGVRNTGNDLVTFRSTTANATISIKAVKLELGSVSTLAMDTAPNYAKELLKCQRYFYRMAQMGNNNYWKCVMANYSNLLDVDVELPTPMRALPTLSGSLTASKYTTTIYSDGLLLDTPFSVPSTRGIGNARNNVTIRFSNLTTTTGAVYTIFLGKNDYIDFSADL